MIKFNITYGTAVEIAGLIVTFIIVLVNYKTSVIFDVSYDAIALCAFMFFLGMVIRDMF